MLEKKEARKRAKQLLAQWEPGFRPDADLKIAQHLEKFLSQIGLFSRRGTLGGFAPLPSEPQWMMGNQLASYGSMAFPRLDGDLMTYHHCKFENLEVHEGNFGIAQPGHGHKPVTPDVLLVPGLAFSRQGERLGRGKGYFDRYLEHFKGIKIGLTFSILVWETLPLEQHDNKIDVLISDHGVIDWRRDK